MHKTFLGSVAALALTLTSSPAQAESPLEMEVETDDGTFSVTPMAQYLLRYRHFEQRDFTSGSTVDFMRHRARLGLDLDWEDRVGVMVQVQDVRVLGEELNTLTDFSADGFDLHQGYARVRPFEGFEFRIGRQEIAYENHRLIGTVIWIEQARSFDAFRMSFQRDLLRLDAFYAKVLDDVAAPHVANDAPGDVDLFAGNLHLAFMPELDVAFVGVSETGPARRLGTAGGIVKGKTSVGFSYEAEGYGQFGNANGGITHRAFLLAGKLGQTFDVTTKPYLQAFTDYVGGDEDPDDDVARSFTTLYATGHKFHGEMDFFLNLPRDTNQAGLLDAGGTIGLSPVGGLDLHATLHHFRTAVGQPNGVTVFGNELDSIASYRIFKPLYIDFVHGVFFPGELYEATRGSDVEHFVYSTLRVTL